MVNFVSPGVYTIEQDSSDFTPGVTTATVGVVGFASRGPINKATLITNQNQLINTFGEPNETISGQGLEGALEILETTNQMYYVRANDDTALNASAGIELGSCPAIQFSSIDLGVKKPLYLSVQVYDQNGDQQYDSPKEFDIKQNTIASGTADAQQAPALKKVIGGDLGSDKVGIYWDTTDTNSAASGYLVGAFAGSGASMSVSAFADSSRTLGVSCFAPVSAVAGDGNTAGDPTAAGFDRIEPDSHGKTVTGPNDWTEGQWAADSLLGAGNLACLSSMTVYGATINSVGLCASSIGYVVESLTPGAGYNNGTNFKGGSSGVEIEVESHGTDSNLVTVLDNGIARESYRVNLFNSGSFVEDVINSTDTDPTSNLIQAKFMEGKNRTEVNAVKVPSFAQKFWSAWDADEENAGARSWTGTSQGTDVNHLMEVVGAYATQADKAEDLKATVSATFEGRFVKLVGGKYKLKSGTDGNMTATQVIGDPASGTGIYALDDESLGIDVALIPGYYNEDAQNALITLAESTQQFMALVAPPEGIGTAQDAIDWSNGRSSNAGYVRTTSINSSYAAVYYPHVQVYSTWDGKNRFYDPSIYAARQICLNDNVGYAWTAPAGYIRGKLSKPVGVEYNVSQGERDAMYSGGNIINPIVNFPNQGVTIFGQRTAQRSATATNRINVRRMLIAIRKAILAGTRQYAFEPNDVFTWTKVSAQIQPFMANIQRNRGITEFRVVCDETTNTSDRIEKGELWCKVILKPTKTAEILVFEVNLTTQSAQLGTL